MASQPGDRSGADGARDLSGVEWSDEAADGTELAPDGPQPANRGRRSILDVIPPVAAQDAKRNNSGDGPVATSQSAADGTHIEATVDDSTQQDGSVQPGQPDRATLSGHPVLPLPPAAVDEGTSTPRGGHGSEMDVDWRANQQLNNLVDKELGDEMEASVSKEIKKLTAELRSRILTLLRLRDRIDRLNADIELMKAQRTPNGFKPFKVVYESKLLDTPIGDNFPDITLRFDRTRTWRDVKRTLYFKFMELNTLVDVKVSKIQENEHKHFCKRESFVDRCTSAFNNAKVCKPDTLGIDSDEEDRLPSMAWFDTKKEQLTTLHKKTKISVAQEREKAEKAKADKEQSKVDALKELSKHSPETLLDAAIDSRLDSRAKKGKGKSSQSSSSHSWNVNHTAAYIAVSNNRSIQENVLEEPKNSRGSKAPEPGGKGKNGKPSSKGKNGKSRGKAKGDNGKGSKGSKGYGAGGKKGNWPGAKGKSRGKGKGSQRTGK
eukprot:TRINITY_DN6092_c0_g1_i4.p2 TRINITY_DN6092_c0_g1~~TRINITY_DN6092_c0_g1_i4.p2  ORF type:complete len:491 (-),score=103.00 TRINITY_DN6092_c0_g1_i4:915-2387(-)